MCVALEGDAPADVIRCESWYNDWSCSRCGMCPLASKLVYSLHACPLPRNYTDEDRRSRPSQKAWEQLRPTLQ